MRRFSCLFLAVVCVGCSSGHARDVDGDGVVDRVDNAPRVANAPRLDMNADGKRDKQDQLDNDFDGAGDPVDRDDDGDAVRDATDDCPLVPDPEQTDRDGDAVGDACDPLDSRDSDGDGVPDGPRPGDPLFDEAKAAKAKWSRGTTHFVIRIDALSRFFQNEFTQLLTDAAVLSPDAWRAKCGEDYADPDDPPDPCGPDLDGGREVPITLVVIPSRFWLDPGVPRWINDRNDNPRLEIGQHGAFHANNTPLGDWHALPDRKSYNCELCGLTQAEAYEVMKVGRDTLLGNYRNRWIIDEGARSDSPRIDWLTAAHPLISFAPPFNTSDAAGRAALARLGFRSFSASVSEEEGFYGAIFTPEETHHERFDQFGMFHVSADVELEPPETEGGYYDRARYEDYLRSVTDDGGLTTWLIEEVEWSGRPCNEDERSRKCAGHSNRENNTVYMPRWRGWLQVLDYVRRYPGGVAMTAGEVALALAFDNAPRVPNPGQADSDHDGVGDVVDRNR